MQKNKIDEDKQKLLEVLKNGENLELEFKSDIKRLPDRELLAAVVSLANTKGGILLLGVEDDGTVTGIHEKHVNVSGIPALISNKTSPSFFVKAEICNIDGKLITKITVPMSRQLIATSEGLILHRRMKIDNTPEAVPFYPHEFIQRQSSFGLIDPSRSTIDGVSISDFDPLQRLRIRNAIKKYGGDQSLLALADDELDGALCFYTEVDGVLKPTVAGLLFLGTENLLRQHIPSYEVAFQVLHGTDVKVNEFYRKPLLETFEEIEVLFKARVEEEEIQIGLFRVPIPNYDRLAFREAFVNSLIHRDFNRLGAVHVILNDDGMNISNPGGFIEGINLRNILVAQPRSRNPLLADIIKRIGLAERTGRGIDIIYEGMLRYGRPAPDYSLSNEFTVSVQMTNVAADRNFLKMLVEEEDKIGTMPIDALIILSCLRQGRQLTTSELALSVQKPETKVHGTIKN